MTPFLLLFARSLGLFLVSPLFSRLAIPKWIRFSLALISSLLIAPPLLQNEEINFDFSPLSLIQLLKEGAIGYLIGFIFSLIIEATAFAGQVVGTLAGFSATELLNPLATNPFPLMSRFFSVIGFTLLFSLDLHHLILRLLYESFEAIPMNFYPFQYRVVFAVIEATGHLFNQALAFSIFPLLMLLLVIVLFAFASRFLSIFWVGFPIQLLVGFGAIALTIGFFAPLLEKAFYELAAMTRKILFPL
ncbi:MAG: flagellar biosynthetic protein FliR [Chlamydiales bacterium]